MSRFLADLREFDERGGWHTQGASSCAHWLAWRVGWDLVTGRERVRESRRKIAQARITATARPAACYDGAGMSAQARLAALAARIEADPTALAALRADGDALAEAAEAADPGGPGGDAALRWRMAVVRAVIAAPPDGDAVRELYGELVDRYRDQPARLGQLRPLGDEIRRLEAEGTLASSLVARSDRRPRRR